MRARRAILHVGSPRTGTTTLQTLLDRHRAALGEAGILYPELAPSTAREHHVNHQRFGETLDGRRPRHERRELLEALDLHLRHTAADVVILSYERLCLLPFWCRAPGMLAALFERHGFAMELLATVRPQAGAVQSQYLWRCQFLREGRSLQEAFETDLRRRRLDPAASFGHWLAAAGGRATAVPLRDANSPEPFAIRVADALTLGDRLRPLLTAEDLARVENGSLDAVAVEVSRRLSGRGIAARDNRRARSIVDGIEEEVRRRGLGGTRFQGLDAGMVARAEERFSRANDRFARRVWGMPWAARVAPDRSGPNTELAARAGALPAATETALREIAEVVTERFGLVPDAAAAGRSLLGKLRWPRG